MSDKNLAANPKKKKKNGKFKEFWRKKLVALKRSPNMIPIVMLFVTFLVFSLNLTKFSNTTAKIQGPNMGLSQFCIMLLSLLALLCLMNSFPRRKKPNIPMIVLLFVMIGIIIFCDVHYMNCILAAVNRAESPIVINSTTQYIADAYSILNTHIVMMIISAALVILYPVYSKLLKKINTSIEVEDNGKMEAIEIAAE